MTLKKCKIKDLGHIYTGNTPPTSDRKYYGDKYPLIKPTDMMIDGRYIGKTGESLSEEGYNLFKGKLVPENTPCVVTIGTIGKLCLTKEPSFCNQAVNSIVVNRELYDPLYVFYLMKISNHKVKFLSSGTASGRENVSKTAFENIEIDVHNLPNQRKITAILSAYDDLIENNTRRIQILEEMAQALYREWFVEFRFPGHEKVKMVESELGMVPEGWEVVSISDVAIIHRGRSYKGTELADKGGLPFINLKCMERDGGFRSSGLKRYTGLFKDTQTVRAGEMVMAITDMTQERRIIARIGRVSRLDADFGVISMDLVRVASLGNLSETYLYAMFRWSGFADELKQHANGANVLHLLPDCIKEHRFVCPTSNIAARFGEIVLPMLSLCDSFELKNKTLRRNRDLLLPKLISGEVDVSSLDIPTGELT